MQTFKLKDIHGRSVNISRKTGARSGFTLTEVMIALTLIAILAIIALPHFGRARDSAQRQQARTDLEILSAAIRQLAWDTGNWPGGIERNVQGNAETWDLTTSAAGILSADNRFSNWKGPYAPKVTADPWGSAYFFDPDYTTSGRVCAVVGSFGPNKEGPNMYDEDDVFVIMQGSAPVQAGH